LWIYPEEEFIMSLRDVVQPNKGDKRHIPRDDNGHFTDSQFNVGKSVAADNGSKNKTVLPKDQGDRGDQKVS
jgi:hypothetical protein